MIGDIVKGEDEVKKKTETERNQERKKYIKYGRKTGIQKGRNENDDRRRNGNRRKEDRKLNK
jgi:hypothetical protein